MQPIRCELGIQDTLPPSEEELSAPPDVVKRRTLLLYLWIRYVIPAAILAVGVWWLLTEVLGVVGTL